MVRSCVFSLHVRLIFVFTLFHLSKGIRGTQIRVIFKLPDEFGRYPSPLAYVHWFKPIHAPVPNLDFYSVSFSSVNHRRSIINVHLSFPSQTLSELVTLFPSSEIRVRMTSVGQLPRYIKRQQHFILIPIFSTTNLQFFLYVLFTYSHLQN